MTLPLRAYFGLTAGAPFVLRAFAKRAHRKMDAPADRLAERLGTGFAPRPQGPLIWINAASVGEAASSLDLIGKLSRKMQAHVVMTTTTASAAQMLATRAPDVIHQFQPIETPAAVAAFLHHWRPDLALFMENDLLPRLMRATAQRGIPMAMLNARVSSTRRRLPRSVGRVLAPMNLISVQDDRAAEELAACGLASDRIWRLGDLKAAAQPLAPAPALAAKLHDIGKDRPIWAAVSTHEGEENIIIAAHKQVLSSQPDTLLVLVPRHPERAEEITAQVAHAGLRPIRHSDIAPSSIATDVLIIDTLGETRAVFEAAPLVFLGGSFAPKGGHNPFEPLASGAMVLHGPHVTNFQAAYDAIDRATATTTVAPDTLAGRVTALLADPQACATLARRAAVAVAPETTQFDALVDHLAGLAK